MTDRVLSVDNLSFAYDKKKEILQNISFEISPGNIIGFLGKNGAGKTTLFDLILGLLTPETGKVGLAITPEEIGYLLQVVTLPPALKIREVVELVANIQGYNNLNEIDSIMAQWAEPMLRRYENIKNLRSGNCSYGEKRWITTATMLVTKYQRTFHPR